MPRLKQPVRLKVTLTLSAEAYQMLERMCEADGCIPLSRMTERIVRRAFAEAGMQLSQDAEREFETRRKLAPARAKHLTPVAGGPDEKEG